MQYFSFFSHLDYLHDRKYVKLSDYAGKLPET